MIYQWRDLHVNQRDGSQYPNRNKEGAAKHKDKLDQRQPAVCRQQSAVIILRNEERRRHANNAIELSSNLFIVRRVQQNVAAVTVRYCKDFGVRIRVT